MDHGIASSGKQEHLRITVSSVRTGKIRQILICHFKKFFRLFRKAATVIQCLSNLHYPLSPGCQKVFCLSIASAVFPEEPHHLGKRCAVESLCFVFQFFQDSFIQGRNAHRCSDDTKGTSNDRDFSDLSSQFHKCIPVRKRTVELVIPGFCLCTVQDITGYKGAHQKIRIICFCRKPLQHRCNDIYIPIAFAVKNGTDRTCILSVCVSPFIEWNQELDIFTVFALTLDCFQNTTE